MVKSSPKTNTTGALNHGLLLMGFALVPMLCAGHLVCKPRRATDEYPLWYLAAAVGPLVCSGLTLVTHTQGMRTLAALLLLFIPVFLFIAERAVLDRLRQIIRR